MVYRAEYLGNRKYRLEADGEMIGIVGEDTICKLIESNKFIDGVCERVGTDYIGNIGEEDDKVVALYIDNSKNEKHNISLDGQVSKLYIFGEGIDYNNEYNSVLRKCIVRNLIVHNIRMMIIGNKANAIVTNIKCSNSDLITDGIIGIYNIKAKDSKLFIDSSPVTINSISMVGKSAHLSVSQAQFSKAQLEADKVILGLNTMEHHDGEVYIDAKETSIIDLRTMYKIYNKQGSIKLNKLYEHSNDTTCINGSIASVKIENLKKNIEISTYGLLTIVDDEVEINSLYIKKNDYNELLVGLDGAKLYIKNKIKYGNSSNKHNVVHILKKFTVRGKIYTDYNTEAYKFLMVNDIKFEVRGGLPENVVKRESKEGMLGINRYKIITDAISTAFSKDWGSEVIDFDLDKDWKYGYIEDCTRFRSNPNFNNRISLATLNIIKAISNLPDIKYEIYDKLDTSKAGIEVNSQGDNGFSTLNMYINYCNSKSEYVKEKIVITKLGRYIIHAAYMTGVKLNIVTTRLDTNSILEKFECVDEIYIGDGKIFIENTHVDKGDRGVLSNFVDMVLRTGVTEILDEINNIVVIPYGDKILAYRCNKQIHNTIPANCKLKKVNYTIEDLANTINMDYNSSRIKKILNTVYKRSKL